MSPTSAELRALARRDPVLGEAMRQVPKFPGFPDKSVRSPRSHFHALVRSVIYQAVSTKAAAVVEKRVVALTKGSMLPKTADFLGLGTDAIRAVGLSGSKVRAILALAEGVEDGSLPLSRLARLSDEDIVTRLSELPGIGEWTAQMFLMFRLGRLDVLPTGDLAVREGLRILDGLEQRPTPTQVRERAEPWRPLRSVASWALYRLCDPG